MKKLQLLSLLLMLACFVPQAARAEYYGIKVGGVDVTSNNASNVTGDNIKARDSSLPFSVVYNASTKTLTLDNIRIERKGSYNRAILNESCDGLLIVIKSHCALHAQDSSPVRLNKNTTIRSRMEDGKYVGLLEILGEYEDGLTVGNGATLTLDGVWGDIYALRSSGLEGATGNEKVIIKNNSIVAFSYSSSYDGNLSIKDIASLDIRGSYVTFGPTSGLESITYSDCMQFKGFYAPYVSIDATTFPDEKLREYILSTDYNYEGKGVLIHLPQGWGYFPINQGNTIEGAKSISAINRDISNAKGLELFVNLTDLNVYENNLSALNVTPFKSLLTLNCGNNKLSALNLTNNTELTNLNCSNNQLTTLNLANQTKLIGLDCGNNQLTSLTLACSDTLTGLRCGGNKLTSLNLSEYKKLNTLYCGTNRLTSLTLPKGDALREVYCYENKLTTLDVSGNTELTYLDCENNKLTTLDVSGNTELTYLDCRINSLTSLNVKNCGKLATLYCNQNKLSELDLTDNTAMTWLDCSNNVLTALNVSKNRDLKRINASYNKLETLDMTWNNKTNDGVIIYGNKIKGEGLDNLIAKLPAVEGRKLYLVDHRYENEDNECTAAQVEAAQNKGWTIYHQWGNQDIPTTECKNYDLWIAGLRACNHGTGFARAKYDNTTTTLTLNNAGITYDGAIAIQSKIDNLNVVLTGKNTINTPGSSIGMRLIKNTENSKVTFSGGGELNITSGGIAFMTHADVEFKDGVKVSAESTDVFNGMQGRRSSGDGNFPSITISGEGTEVKAKGGSQGSVLNFHALNLNDGITIAEPFGATFAEDYGVIKDNRIVAGEWVVFAGQDYIDGIKDLKDSKDLNDLNDSTYNLAGQKVGKDYKGIVIQGGKKLLKK
jgi:hypothetical protein